MKKKTTKNLYDIKCTVCETVKRVTVNGVPPATAPNHTSTVLRRLRALGWTADNPLNLVCPKCSSSAQTGSVPDRLF